MAQAAAPSWENREQKNKRRGMITSLVFHALLLLLFLFFGLKHQFPPPGEAGVLINFGNVETGFGEEAASTVDPVLEESEAPVADEVDIQPTPQAPSEPVEEVVEEVVTQDVEPAPVIKEEKVKEPEKKQLEKETKTETKVPVETPEEREAKLKAAKEAEAQKKAAELMEQIKKNKAESEGKSTGTGNQGDPQGDPKSPNYNGKTTGLGDDGIGLSWEGEGSGLGRGIAYKPAISDDSQNYGLVVVRIKVDRDGKVTDAQFVSRGSTTTNMHLVNKALKAAREVKFDPNPNAPFEQTGRLTFNFQLK